MFSRRWQDRANLVLGTWIFVSPPLLGYGDSIAAWNAYVMGAGIVLFALIAARIREAPEEIVNILFGVWLVLSPFALGFAAETVVALHTVLCGILATAFAIWAMSNERSFYQRWNGGHSV